MMLFGVVLLIAGVYGQSELLSNNDMESTDFSDNWIGSGCTLASSTDALTGSRSVYITNRGNNGAGLQQKMVLQNGGRYNFTLNIKLESLTALFQTVELRISCTLDDGTKKVIKFGKNKGVRLNRWTFVGGIAVVAAGSAECKAYVFVFGSSVNYRADDASLHLVPDIADWESDANARIESIRKADIEISLSGAAATFAYDVQVTQKSHEFAFGSAVNSVIFNDPASAKYTEVFNDLFEWAVLENWLKWNLMEKTQFDINFSKAMPTLEALKANGKKVRGHCVFWSTTQDKNPAWLSTFSPAEVESEIQRRINYVVNATKGYLEHWDVNNEHEHGRYFEEKTGDIDVTLKMFTDIHAVDSHTKNFLNDYGVLEQSLVSVAYYEEAKMIRESGVPIHGVGIQSHLKAETLDMTSMKARLDRMALAGLPLWITEMSVEDTNVTRKAQKLEDAMRMFFSHPSVEGVLIWGFWDGKIFADSAKLFEGPDVTPNAAGSALITLLKTTWNTTETHSILGSETLTTRGFKGQYEVEISQGSNVLHSETFELTDAGKQLQINLSGSNTQGFHPPG